MSADYNVILSLLQCKRGKKYYNLIHPPTKQTLMFSHKKVSQNMGGGGGGREYCDGGGSSE